MDPQGLAEPITEDTPTDRVVGWTLQRFAGQRLVLTSSFGMEGCALIDMYAKHNVPLTVIYLDTMFFFKESYDLRDRMVERYPHVSFINRGTTLTPGEGHNRAAQPSIATHRVCSNAKLGIGGPKKRRRW